MSPPGGSPPRDMTSFTFGTTSPPHALSATACAMGFNLRPLHIMLLCTTHYDVLYLLLTCVMVLNLSPRGDT